MADSDNDILRDAIIGTEKEIFGDAFGKEDVTLDETGDRSHEAMGEGLEGQVEPDEGEDEDETSKQELETQAKPDDTKVETKAETKVEVEPKPEDRQDDRGRVPAGRLREQTERAKAAEAERDALKAQADADRARYDARVQAIETQNAAILAALQRGQQAPPKAAEAPKPEVPPDLFENPNAYAEYLKREALQPVEQLRRQMDEQRINMSMAFAQRSHGPAFDAAFNALKTLPQIPDNVALVRRVISSPDPGEEVVRWHKRNEVIREVGDDPASYKARIADETRKAMLADPEFRKQMLADLRADAQTGDNGHPRTETRLPGSLARATGGNSRAPNDLDQFDGSDQATFASAWTA